MYHLNRYGLEGSKDDLSALVQPLSVSANLQRRLVDKWGGGGGRGGFTMTFKQGAFFRLWFCCLFFFLSLTSEAMVKPITSMQPSSWRCGSKSR